MIRNITGEEGARFLALMRALDQESSFMLLEPGERHDAITEIEAYLNGISQSPVKALFVAEEEEELVGFVEVTGDEFKRIRHRAEIVIGIREAYQGKGLGKALIAQAIQWAKEN
ncbi:MAG TPA: GNAT family N-acetyltransferase, partial [Sporolactobacillaceae bacterium]|nr:GNAT family N-acetyltransferase [Sporolactobacillaceae bacterium]